MKQSFSKILIGTIIIGLIGYCFNLIFGNSVGFIEIERHNGILIYTYNFFDYLENLRNSFSGTTALTLELPTREFITLEGTNILESDFWQAMGNNMALMLDYIIFALNILLWPLRLGAYLIRAILAIIGINVIPPITHNLKWLVDLVNNMIEFIQIPYI